MIPIIYYFHRNIQPEPAPGIPGKPSIGVTLNVIKVWRSRIISITEASRALRTSTGIRTVLEYILVFGNYLNSATRAMAIAGQAYGFKLQNLELIVETKSSADRSRCLLHYVAECIQRNVEGESGLSLYFLRVWYHNNISINSNESVSMSNEFITFMIV